MAAACLREFAPAKVNLTLRVLSRRADGFHELESLVAFADVGDELALLPGSDVALTLSGQSAALIGDQSDNLVLKAWTALRERVDGLVGGHFTLVKTLPVAAGLGGGSSDAAAALRLLARLNGLNMVDPRLMDAASAIGSDVPACLAVRSCVMRGRGEILSAPVTLPKLEALLVNPRVSVPTPAVFRALGLTVGQAFSQADADVKNTMPYADFIVALEASGNDLEPAATAIEPVIADVKAALADGADLVRMSGSGASVFALYATAERAEAAERRISKENPNWWAMKTRLG